MLYPKYNMTHTIIATVPTCHSENDLWENQISPVTIYIFVSIKSDQINEEHFMLSLICTGGNVGYFGQITLH